MSERLYIKEVVQIDGYGLVVYFSDQTFASYTVDELSRLRPTRETAKKVPHVRDASELS